MERQPITASAKLIEVVAGDYPTASEILVSFPDEWEFIRAIKREPAPIYIAAFPPAKEKPSRDHFPGLSAEANLSLTAYRLYRFFQPWVTPSVIVEWNVEAGHGHVIGRGDTKVQLQPVGQAQVWLGREVGVLWECYLYESHRQSNWQELLAEIWHLIETDVAPRRIYTDAREPTFEDGYEDFLHGLGYTPDADSPRWWSKEVAHDSGL